MSLVAFAVRTCLCRALLGRTLARDQVFDSEIAAIDKLKSARGPVIVLGTDVDKIDNISGWDVMRAGRKLDIVLNLFIAKEVEIEGVRTITIPATDAGMEATLAFLGREIQFAMTASAGPWAEIFQVLTSSVVEITTDRGGDLEDGVRYAAHQITITCDPVHEPAFGFDVEAPEHADSEWTKLVALMETDGELDDLAVMLRAGLMIGPTTEWQRTQASLGLSTAGIFAMGLGPSFGADLQTGEPPTLTSITLDDDERGLIGPLTADHPTAYEIPQE